ncbi:hypothetical protein [Domibacillus indicus]|uniref:hypothetical protein n=1 Tax=Domibacillus indicus TaxID=1437523 RepID=UPI0006182C9E|nr:hypothetical protein [Domibacillus indicus]
MHKIHLIVFTVIAFFTLSGCVQDEQTAVSSPPSAEEVLEQDTEADLFQYKDTVYQTNIDWVDELELTKKQEIGEVRAVFSGEDSFSNGMSTKLPAGTKLYSVQEREDILMSGDGKKYLALSEG